MDIGENPIVDFPSNLVSLRLTKQQLFIFQNCITKMGALKYLNLSDDELEEIPKR